MASPQLELAHLVIAAMEGMILLAKISDSDVGVVPVDRERARALSVPIWTARRPRASLTAEPSANRP